VAPQALSLPPLMPLIETVLSPNYHQVWVGAPVAPKWPLGNLRCTSVALVPPGGGAEEVWERHTPTPHNTAHPRSRVITVELFLADSATEAAGPQVVPYSHRLPAAPAAVLDASGATPLNALRCPGRAGDALVLDGACWCATSADSPPLLRLQFTNSDNSPPPALTAEQLASAEKAWGAEGLDGAARQLLGLPEAE